jgi:sortase B
MTTAFWNIIRQKMKAQWEYLQKNPIRGGLFLLCLCVLLYALGNIAAALWDYRKSSQAYEDVKKLYYQNADAQQAVGSPSNTPVPVESVASNTPALTAGAAAPAITPVPSAVPAGPIYKDPRLERTVFKELQKINKDIVGWLRIPGTRVDYPVLQGKDNQYYLEHSFTGEKIRNASIFMDYRNKVKKTDFNTILYGHNMHDGSMLTDIVQYKEEVFFQKNVPIFFDTLYQKGKWEVFAVYVTNTSFDYLVTNFKTPEESTAFINTVMEKSMYKKEITLTPEDHVLTLSTCSYEFKDARTVVQAKLVK